MPLVLGGSSAVTAAYDVDNSCRIDEGSGTDMYMVKSSSSVASQTIGTISVWVKRTNRITNAAGNADTQIIGQSTSGHCRFMFTAAGQFKFNGPTRLDLITNALCRDFSAWYHLFVAWDTTGGVQADRVKMYINGTRITSFATELLPNINDNLDFFVDSQNLVIGRSESAGGYDYLDGYLSEFVCLEGTAAAVTDFGEFNSDSPTIWQPIEHDQSGNKGANGFYLDFKDSANLGNDAYGGTDFTETNIDATDQATDSPTNNFATYNNIATVSYKQGAGSYQYFAEGNTKVVENGGVYKNAPTTLASFSGKWYCELKFVGTVGGSLLYSTYGGVLTSHDVANIGDTYNHVGQTAQSVGYGAYDGKTYISDTGTSYGDTLADGDILGIALDLDNSKVYFSKNSVWQNSGDPTSGATGTGAVSLPASDSSWHVGASPTNSTLEANFGGCPGFAITSGNADANGYGNFEYAVPSGYYALCTKNLAEFGG